MIDSVLFICAGTRLIAEGCIIADISSAGIACIFGGNIMTIRKLELIHGGEFLCGCLAVKIPQNEARAGMLLYQRICLFADLRHLIDSPLGASLFGRLFHPPQMCGKNDKFVSGCFFLEIAPCI